MKFIAALIALTLVAPLWSASPKDAFLVRADSVTVVGERTIAMGNASVISGETRLTADEIVFESSSGTLTLAGRVTIQTGEATIAAKEATLNLHGKRVFMLAKGNIVVPGAQPFDTQVGSEYLRLFSTPFPATDTQLPRTLLKQ